MSRVVRGFESDVMVVVIDDNIKRPLRVSYLLKGWDNKARETPYVPALNRRARLHLLVQ